MPELPEVETVARGLRRTILGRRILSVTFGKTDFVDDAAAIEQHLPGRRIEVVERYGKFMLLRLSPVQDGQTAAGDEAVPAALLVHLGMTGQIASIHPEKPWEKHTHASFVLDDGKELRYTDARRFGRLAYLSGDLLLRELERFGADPLEVTVEEFAKRIRSRRSRIKSMLLDQSVLRGVGNIYADESLWKAKIHPAKLGASLTKQQATLLHRSLKDILLKAIVMRGSSISDFLGADGEPGEYQGQHHVYGREGKPCHRCHAIIRRAVVAGRSSHFCPKCQPGPRGFISLTLRGKKVRPTTSKSAVKTKSPSLHNKKKRLTHKKRNKHQSALRK